MHEGAHVEEHVVEGVDGQASSLIGVFQRHDGGVQGVGQITETWPACFNHFLGALPRALQKDGGKKWSQTNRINHSEAESAA